MRQTRLAIEWWVIALITSAVVLFLVHDRTTQRLDRLVYDVALQLLDQAPDPRILIVAIDDDSVRDVGPWPWSRDVQARLVSKLGEGRPTAVAYDVLLVDRRPGDDALGQAMVGAVPVFVPLLMRAPGTNGALFDAVLPVAQVRNGAQGIGHVNLAVDSDGKVRRARLFEGDDRGRWPHLMELMRRAGGGPSPAGTGESYLIPFSGAAGHFPTIGAAPVMRGEIPPGLLRDRLVLVGVTAGGLGDRYATAGGNWRGVLPGVELQAQLLNGLLSDGMIREAGMPSRALFSLLPLWAFLLALRKFQPGAVLAVLAGLTLATLTASLLILTEARLWLTPVPAFAGLAFVYPLWGWRRLVTANHYMVRELERFHEEADTLPAKTRHSPALDPVSRHLVLLNDAIEHSRNAQRQREDTIRFLSHDMRSPQASILAILSQAGEREIEPKISAQIENYARRTMNLADGFVQLARAETLRYEPEPVALSDVLLDAVDQVWPRAAARKVIIEVDGEDESLIVAGERSLLTRAIINLLDNAVRHSPEGERISCRLAKIEEEDEKMAVCMVSDRGPGIEAEHLSTLFERFKQAPGDGGIGGGAGLGLHFVHRVAARHGGWVRCISRAGAGASFTLGLPLLTDVQLNPAQEVEARPQRGGPGRSSPFAVPSERQ
jgi:CHASE2 domain-containing sensor protein